MGGGPPRANACAHTLFWTSKSKIKYSQNLATHTEGESRARGVGRPLYPGGRVRGRACRACVPHGEAGPASEPVWGRGARLALGRGQAEAASGGGRRGGGVCLTRGKQPGVGWVGPWGGAELCGSRGAASWAMLCASQNARPKWKNQTLSSLFCFPAPPQPFYASKVSPLHTSPPPPRPPPTRPSPRPAHPPSSLRTTCLTHRAGGRAGGGPGCWWARGGEGGDTPRPRARHARSPARPGAHPPRGRRPAPCNPSPSSPGAWSEPLGATHEERGPVDGVGRGGRAGLGTHTFFFF